MPAKRNIEKAISDRDHDANGLQRAAKSESEHAISLSLPGASTSLSA